MAPPPRLPAAAAADTAWRSSLTACDSCCGPPRALARSSAWGPSIASARVPWVGRIYGSATVTGRMVRGRFGTSSALFSSPAPDLSDGVGGGAAKVAPAAQGTHQRFLCLRVRRHPRQVAAVYSNACPCCRPSAIRPPANRIGVTAWVSSVSHTKFRNTNETPGSSILYVRSTIRAGIDL